MYSYSEFDEAFVRSRVRGFRAQVERRISGRISEDEFKPYRLMNGLYLQLHAYMLRVAIPYGTFNSRQMNQLANIADRWDKGYGHFTTRQNIQFNWPKLGDVPDILDALADVEMHAIQTSGNTIRNVTADHFAGAAAEEVTDPRPYAELIRQWSTDHPEFQTLPRKFKIAVTGSAEDRAVTAAHDIGLRLVRNDAGEIGFTVIVGGGLGRTPMIGKILSDFVSEADILPYIEAVVHVWNQLGRRDNKYKARIKITVHELGIETIRAAVNEVFPRIRAEFGGNDQALLEEIQAAFAPPSAEIADASAFHARLSHDGAFRSFVDTNTARHRYHDYRIVTISLKPHGATPGDITSEQMRSVASLAKTYAHDEIRASHVQNLVLPHVHVAHLPEIYDELKAAGLATANIGKVSDIIACPGMDYCALATARSIPVAQSLATSLQARELEIGDVEIKISGCINACGHHHVGHIGILGLDRAGVENYQITLGGNAGADAVIGERTGPGFAYDEIVPAIERVLDSYLHLRNSEAESFIDTYARLGAEPFKAALYPDKYEAKQDAA